MSKTILITGASSGIGYELAREAARNGASLILIARRTERLEALREKLIREYRIKVHVISADLTKPDAVRSVFQWVQSNDLRVDYLINNAGFGDMHEFQDTKLETIEEMIRLNIVTLTSLTRLFLPAMLKAESGKIMNVASTAAFQPGPGMAVYYATKAYVLSFSQALAQELRGSGITVTALCPGPTLSEFQQVAGMDKSPLLRMLKVPSSQVVARYGYRAMLKGKTVAIEGVLNKILANSVRFFPRQITLWLIHRLQKSRSSARH